MRREKLAEIFSNLDEVKHSTGYKKVLVVNELMQIKSGAYDKRCW